MTTMPDFATRIVSARPDAIAPDGSEVRALASLPGCSMAQFTLPAGTVAKAVRHRTVDEIWFVTKGAGEIWRRQNGREEITPLVDLSGGMTFTFDGPRRRGARERCAIEPEGRAPGWGSCNPRGRVQARPGARPSSRAAPRPYGIAHAGPG